MSNEVYSLVKRRVVGSPVVKSVLLYMADNANDTGEGVWTSKATMAADLELGERTINRSVAELLERGLIYQVGHRPCARGYTVDYSINLQAIVQLPSTRPVRHPTPATLAPHPRHTGTPTPATVAGNPLLDPPLNLPRSIHAPSEPDLFGKEDPQKEGSQKEEKKDPGNVIDLAFERFWQAYPAGPRKTDKPQCRATFKAICAGKQKGIPATDPERIISGALGYRPEAQYQKGALAWLRGERWNDVQAPSDAVLPGGVTDLDMRMAWEGVTIWREKRAAGTLGNWEQYDLMRWNLAQKINDQLKRAGVVPPWSGGGTPERPTPAAPSGMSQAAPQAPAARA